MHDSQPRSPRGRLADPHYRAEMLARLDSLMAVLRVARKQAGAARLVKPEDGARLTRLHGNLSKTLDVCASARRSLRAPQTRGRVPQMVDPKYRRFIESSSFAEFRRLCAQGPVAPRELKARELDALCDRLASEDAGDDEGA